MTALKLMWLDVSELVRILGVIDQQVLQDAL